MCKLVRLRGGESCPGVNRIINRTGKPYKYQVTALAALAECADTILQMGAICKMTTSTNATDEYNGMKTIEGARCLVEPWSYHHNSVLLPAPPNPINTLNCLSEIFNLYLPITFIVPAYTPSLRL